MQERTWLLSPCLSPETLIGVRLCPNADFFAHSCEILVQMGGIDAVYLRAATLLARGWRREKGRIGPKATFLAVYL
jgi:hypothetical protein